MSRRISMFNRFSKKEFKCDNYLINLLVNKILKNGKKQLARRIVYNAFNLIENRIKKDPIYILEKAIKNIGPRIQVVLKSNGKKFYPTPILLNKYSSSQTAIKWIVEISRKHSGKSMSIKLSNELIDAYKKIGNLIKKKEATHRYAESNKSYAQYEYNDNYEV